MAGERVDMTKALAGGILALLTVVGGGGSLEAAAITGLICFVATPIVLESLPD